VSTVTGRSRLLTRRRFLASVGVLGAGVAADGFLIEPQRLDVTRHVLDLPDGDGDASSAVLRVVQLTDLHIKEVSGHEEQVAREVRALSPSIIVLTGDSIDRRDRLEVLDEFLALLDPATPKFAVLGNWEYFCQVEHAQLGRVYERHGGRLLINETARVEHGGRRVLITGLDDLLAGTPQMARAVRDESPDRNHVVLAHCPMHRDYLWTEPHRPWLGDSGPPAAPPDPASQRFHPRLVLSGHTHGGQVNIGGFCPWRPWGSGPYVSGWYRSAATDLYVSRGIGTVSVPVRFGSRPELACFDWNLG
jgi:predicted MPP superfamily phosphohydrolase